MVGPSIEGRVYAIPPDCAYVLRIDPRATVKVKHIITEENNNNNNNECGYESESQKSATEPRCESEQFTVRRVKVFAK